MDLRLRLDQAISINGTPPESEEHDIFGKGGCKPRRMVLNVTWRNGKRFSSYYLLKYYFGTPNLVQLSYSHWRPPPSPKFRDLHDHAPETRYGYSGNFLPASSKIYCGSRKKQILGTNTTRCWHYRKCVAGNTQIRRRGPTLPRSTLCGLPKKHSAGIPETREKKAAKIYWRKAKILHFSTNLEGPMGTPLRPEEFRRTRFMNRVEDA